MSGVKWECRCEDSLRVQTECSAMPPKQSGGGVEEAEWRRREQSIDPKTEAVLAEAESSGASAKNARGWRCLGRNRLTEGVFVKTAISVLRVGSIILALPSADDV